MLALEASATALKAPLGPDLEDAITDFAAMIEPRTLATADPLGIGGLLCDALRLHRLLAAADHRAPRRLYEAIVDAAATGLALFARRQELRAPAEYRLGFRELGLAKGLAASEELAEELLTTYSRLRTAIEAFWLDPVNRASRTWQEHRDINDVMLATSLSPDGFLGMP